jgi:hypothetical protein
MEVVKEEIIKLKNSSVKNLLSYYSKLVNADFEEKDMEIALSIVEDSFKVEDAFKAYQKLEKNTLEKYQKMEKDGEEITPEVVQKINDKLKALSEEFAEIKGPLTKVPEHIRKLIKFKPIELKVLKEVNVI